MTEIIEYPDAQGISPYVKWFDHLNVAASVKVAVAAIGWSKVTSVVKGVGAGVYEYRIDFSPGYRIYFGEVSGHRHCCCKWAQARL